jgi:hypothetical protein
MLSYGIVEWWNPGMLGTKRIWSFFIKIETKSDLKTQSSKIPSFHYSGWRKCLPPTNTN